MANREDGRTPTRTTDRSGAGWFLFLVAATVAAIVLFIAAIVVLARLANDDDNVGPERRMIVEDVAESDVFGDDAPASASTASTSP